MMVNGRYLFGSMIPPVSLPRTGFQIVQYGLLLLGNAFPAHAILTKSHRFPYIERHIST